MSRIVSSKELKLIEQAIAERPEGIGISALEKSLVHSLPHINRRTLQRRLQKLQNDKRIIPEGESIARIYKIAPNVTGNKVSLFQESNNFETVGYIPVSKEGKLIRDLVCQPLTKRKPVGYHRSFLDEYQPEVTFYLSKSLRSQLHEIGVCKPGIVQPAAMHEKSSIVC